MAIHAASRTGQTEHSIAAPRLSKSVGDEQLSQSPVPISIPEKELAAITRLHTFLEILFLIVEIGQKTHCALSLIVSSKLSGPSLLFAVAFLRRRAVLQFGQCFRVMEYPSRIFSQSIFIANDLEE